MPSSQGFLSRLKAELLTMPKILETLESSIDVKGQLEVQ